MKIRETHAHGFGGGHIQYRVRELSPGEEIPAGASVVPDDTPVTNGWQNEEAE